MKDQESMLQAFSKAREKYLIKSKHITKIILEQYKDNQKINISGTVNNIEVWMPLEWTRNSAKLLSIALSSHITHSSLSQKDYFINSLTNSISKVDHLSNLDDSKVTVKGLKVKIEQIKDLGGDVGTAISRSIKNEFIRSTLLKCPRVEINFESEAQVSKNQTDSSLLLQIMPVTVNLGFVEINEFKSVTDRIMKILDSLKQQNQKIIDKVYDDYKEVQLTITDMVQRYATTVIDGKTSQNITAKKKYLAPTKHTNMFKLVVTIEEIQASLIDDLGLHHQPLITFILNYTRGNINIESGKECAESFILRRLGIYEDPYLKADFNIDIQAKYFNYESGVSEPFIEP